MLKDYYEPTYTTSENGCEWTGKNLLVPGKCPEKGFNGDLRPNLLGEKGVADTFNYLERLFNTEKIPKVSAEQSKKIKAALEPHREVYQKLLAQVQHVRGLNGYGKVDLGQAFEFMKLKHNL